MISALGWVPKGVARRLPVKGEFTKEELEGAEAEGSADDQNGDVKSVQEGYMDVGEEAEEEEEEEEEEQEDEEDPAARAREVATALKGKKPKLGAGNGLRKPKAGDPGGLMGDLAELNMDQYDEEDSSGLQIFGNGGLNTVYYASNEDDPYITLKEEEDEEEREDFELRESDLLLVAARNEDDVSHLEVWVYEEREREDDEANMYVHHDIMLPAFPLSLAWLDCDIRASTSATPPSASSHGNYIAVGTLQPEIEIWDLDVVDEVEPVVVLGGRGPTRVSAESAAAPPETSAEEEEQVKKKKKTKRKPAGEGGALRPGSHSDAVMALSWNAEYKNVLASGSADCSVKVWDVAAQRCEHTMTHHSGKVQAVAWNPKEPPVLLSGSFDKTAAMVDARVPEREALVWRLTADVECLAWDPHHPQCFVVSTEDGLVSCFDARKGGLPPGAPPPPPPQASAALFVLHAHDKATCAVAFNHAVPDLLSTASTDKMVKLWDTVGNKPSCLSSTNPKVGAVFSMAFCVDSPFLLAVGGSRGNLHVWDVLSDAAVGRRYGSFVRQGR